MTGKPTEKMVWRLKKLGRTDAEIANMTYEVASEIIGNALGNKPQMELVKTQDGTFIAPKGTFTGKPAYNPSSQYVSYAKDIFLQLREMIHVEVMKPGSKLEVVSDEIIMARAISLVKIAIKEFE